MSLQRKMVYNKRARKLRSGCDERPSIVMDWETSEKTGGVTADDD